MDGLECRGSEANLCAGRAESNHSRADAELKFSKAHSTAEMMFVWLMHCAPCILLPCSARRADTANLKLERSSRAFPSGRESRMPRLGLLWRSSAQRDEQSLACEGSETERVVKLESLSDASSMAIAAMRKALQATYRSTSKQMRNELKPRPEESSA